MVGGADREALRADFARQMGQLEELTTRVRQQAKQLNRQLETERAELRAARVEASDDYERDARSGAAGEARQELQRRLDRGETTWHAVVSGQDEHWSASAVRDEVVGEARAEVDQLELDDPELARAYREHAVLRDPRDRPGEWSS